ncbi:MAG: GNVR domain-containing protein [Bryobacteraceae bacterium]
MRRSEFSPLSLLRATWKNKGTALAVWAVLSLGTVATVYRLPSIYKAETLILVESQKIPEKLVSSTVNAELQDRLATISQEVLSATRLQGLIDKFGLYKVERGSHVQEEIIEMMRKDMSIKLERGWTRNQPGAFRVTYQGTNPETIAAVVNQIGNFFIEENLKAREEQATGTSEFLKAQMDEAKKGLEEQERKLSEYKRQHPGELPQQENSILGALANLHLQLQGNQDATARAEENKVILETTLSAAESSLAGLMSAGRQTRADGTIRTSQGAIASAPNDGRPKESDQLKVKLDALRARYTDSYPEVQETLAMLERTLQEEEARAKQLSARAAAVAQNSEPSTSQTPEAQAQGSSSGVEYTPDIRREQERVATLRAQAAAAAKDLEDRKAERSKILADINSYQGRVENLPVREQEMAGVLRDYQISKANYEQLLSKNLSADMSTDMEKRQKAEKFTVLDVARIPEKPFKPMRPLLYWGGIIFALVIGVAAAFVRELKRNVVLGEWELPHDITILGRVPRIEFSAADVRNSPFAESA